MRAREASFVAVADGAGILPTATIPMSSADDLHTPMATIATEAVTEKLADA